MSATGRGAVFSLDDSLDDNLEKIFGYDISMNEEKFCETGFHSLKEI